MGHFQFLKSIFRPKINLIILKMIFALEYQTKTSLILFIFIKLYLVKMCSFLSTLNWGVLLDISKSFEKANLDVKIY